MIHLSEYNSPLGDILLAAEGEALIGLWLRGQHPDKFLIDEKTIFKESEAIKRAKWWLDCYFTHQKPDLKELILAPRGTIFLQMVWKLLLKIAYGQMTTYGELAKEVAYSLNKPKMSAQAIGGAVGQNPISIIIPCHRVVGYNGNLTGYAGGLPLKIKLLAHEGVSVEKLHLPKNYGKISKNLEL